MAFEDAITRLNAAVTSRLSNVTAQVDGQSVRGLFDRDHLSVDGIGTTTPALDIELSDAPFVESGSSVPIGIESFEVANVRPDGAGRVLLTLKAED